MRSCSLVLTAAAAAAAASLLAACAADRSATAARPAESAPAARGWTPEYPAARRSDQTETLHGVAIADPYRWLENPDAPESRTWIDAQNELTDSYIGAVSQHDELEERLTKLWDYERYTAPSEQGGRYFFFRNDGLQNQSVMYVADALNAEPRVLLDPNALSADGTVALSSTSVTDDGRLLAYGVSDGGSDWVTFRVRDVATGQDLPDVVRWAKFTGAAWLEDGSGFFYSRYDAPDESKKLEDANYYQKLYFHRVGTDQSQDELVLEDKGNKDWGFSGSVTDDGRYLIVNVWRGTERKNKVYFREIGSPSSGFVRLIDEFEARYNFVDNDGPIFWFFTDSDAPLGRVIAIDTRNPARGAWKTVIAESDASLQGVSSVGNQLIASYLRDAKTEVKAYDHGGRVVRTVRLPGIGTAGGFGGERSDNETFYTFTNFNTPPTVYRYDVPSGRSEVWRAPEVAFDPKDFESRQVFYTSADGTKIPMFIVHKRGLRLTGENPTLLYGYGGFNIPLTPTFSAPNLVWMEMGGVLAIANLRGGGEYGKKWHDAGKLENKQNVFDDFIAAAEWLIANRYTRPEKLAIHGRSNGGLLVGACMVQRPDLFGACLPGVGVLDMLRFHKFTIGWAWVSDYGSPDDADQFKTLLAYSPLHNLKPGTCYPPTLITTADHDDRVVPAHSFKFAAALQNAQGCDNPVLIRIETRAGHGAGKPTTKQIEEWADIWAFLVRALDMNPAI